MPLFHGRVLASGIMVPVNVDADGDLQVDILAALPAGTNLLGDVQARNLGYISGAWQKNPLAFGYSGKVLQVVSNTTLAAGTNNLDTAAVPASRIWVITSIAAVYIGTIGGVALRVSLVSSATAYTIFDEVHVVNSERIDRQGWWVIGTGDFVRLTVTGATLNDDAVLTATGFYVDIAL